MLVAAYVLTGLLLLAGLAGAALPLLPGTPLILAGALVYALATDFERIGAGRLLILAGMTALTYLLDYAAGAVGARRYGGSGWAVVGALVGGVVGLFFGPLGILAGPILGAVAGELLRSGQLEQSLRSGYGTLLGALAGAVAKLGVALAMVGLFLWWIWHG